MRTQIESLLQTRIRKNQPIKLTLLIVFSLAIGFLAQFVVNEFAGRELVFCLIPPVFIIAWYSGFFPGLFAALFSVTAADFFLFDPRFAFDLTNRSDMITLGAYSFIAIPGAWVFSKLASKTLLLNLAQNELEMTLKSIGDAVLVVNRENKVAFLNPIAEKLTGWTLKEARGRNIDEVFQIVNEATRAKAFNPVEQVLREGIIVGLANHTVLISKDGTEFQIEDSAAPIRAYEGDSVAGVVLVFRDVTSKYATEKRVNQTLDKLEAVISELGEGIVFTDGSGANFQMNKAALHMHGFKSSQDMFEHFEKYKNIFSLTTLDGKSIDPSIWPLSKVLKGERFQDYEAIVTRTDNGHSFIASYGGTPIFDNEGKVSLAVINVKDISKRATTEFELKKAKDEAEQASHLKTSFLANMSHEIRTPLGAIMGFVDLLRQPNLTPEDFKSYVSVIGRNSDQLLRIIDDILDLSKVEAGKMSVEKVEFSLIELLADLTSLLGLKAQEKGIQFSIRAETLLPDPVITDQLRVRQILSNIIGNAIKFTNKGSIEVLVYYNPPYISFRVIDSGTGISQEQKIKLFQPFSQADASTTRKFGGTGLGLVLTQKFCETLGGEFYLESSELGKGSVFFASVKVEQPKDSKLVDKDQITFTTKFETKELPENSPLKGMRVLVVEDAPDNQQLIKIYLQKLGCSVVIAADGKLGVEKALQNSFDVILMDIQMPNMDGHDATRLLRSKGYKTPIIALTAHAMKEERQRALDSGFNGFLSKPIHRDQLIETLERFVLEK